MIDSGAADCKKITTEMRKILQKSALIEIEYISIVNADTLTETAEAKGKILAAIAARVGPGRLIDNIFIDTTK